MNRYSMAIAKFLGSGAQVIGEVNADDPDELVIVFRPLGDRLNVSEVNFTGNASLTQQELLAYRQSRCDRDALQRAALPPDARFFRPRRLRREGPVCASHSLRSKPSGPPKTTVWSSPSRSRKGEVYKLGDVTFTGRRPKARAGTTEVGAMDRRSAHQLHGNRRWPRPHPQEFSRGGLSSRDNKTDPRRVGHHARRQPNRRHRPGTAIPHGQTHHRRPRHHQRAAPFARFGVSRKAIRTERVIPISSWR